MKTGRFEMGDTQFYLRRLADRLRYNQTCSHVLAFTCRPVRNASMRLGRQIESKIRVNGLSGLWDGIPISFPKDVGVSYATDCFWNHGAGFEPFTWRALKCLIGDACTFVDVGSNIGIYSVLAKKIKPDLIVHSFEPVPSIFEKSVAFHEANRLSVANLHNLALSNQRASTILYLPRAVSFEEESTGTLRRDSWQAERSEHAKVPVATALLDDFISSLVSPVLIKIDVEDFEAQVLDGSRKVLSDLRPIVVLEILPRSHRNQETAAVLKRHNYALWAITDFGLFRVAPDDLGQPRSFRDFVAFPLSAGGDEQRFVSFEKLGEFAKERALFTGCA